MNKNDAAIVVVSFDNYSDIWDTFATCINRFWSDRPYKTYLVTNEKHPQYEGISIITTGPEESWSVRVKQALSKINEKYLIVLLEDYLIDENVNNDLLERTLNYIEKNSIDYFRIAPIPKISGKADSFHAIPIKGQTVYGVNLQAAVWNKTYLEALVSEGSFSAWEFEARQKIGAETYIDGKNVASDIFIIHYLNGIIQGKWYNKTIDALKTKGINVSLGGRSIMTNKDMKREIFRNYLLHHVPPSLIRLLKPIARKLGFKFVTE